MNNKCSHINRKKIYTKKMVILQVLGFFFSSGLLAGTHSGRHPPPWLFKRTRDHFSSFLFVALPAWGFPIVHFHSRFPHQTPPPMRITDRAGRGGGFQGGRLPPQGGPGGGPRDVIRSGDGLQRILWHRKREFRRVQTYTQACTPARKDVHAIVHAKTKN